MTTTAVPYISRHEAAGMLNISERSVNRLLAAGKLKRYRLAGMTRKVYLRRDEVESLIRRGY